MCMDAICILAGGVNDDGTLPEDPRKRVEAGVTLWRESKSSKLIMSGKYGFWLDFLGHPPKKTEALAMRDYAISLGVPAQNILIEDESKDTVGNAYFLRVNFIDKNGWKKFAVVTSDYHMQRTKIIFDQVFGDAYKIEYVSASAGLSQEKMKKWKKSEEKTISVLKHMMGDIKSGDIGSIKEALFTRHPGYAKNPKITIDMLRGLLGRDKREIN